MSASSLISQVDSDRFGFLIGRASISDSESDGITALLERCRAESVRMLILRCPTTSSATVHAAQQHGALLMDTLVYYRRNLLKGEPPPELKPNLVRLAVDADVPTLRQLAQDVFKGYRGHYHADPALPTDKCDEGYADWATRMCSQRNATSDVLIGEYPPATVAGFATVRLNSPQEGEGVLFGVHPAAEGRGMYWSFMLRAMEWSAQRGATRMVVSTQITNMTVQKVWSRMGFELYASYYTLHLWL